jgi:hypothetical protein
MFRNEMTDLKQFASKKDKRAAFETWKLTHLPDGKNLFFEGEKQVIKGEERTFVVASFGDYEDANRCARRFVAYRCGLGNITRVYSWLWHPDEKRWIECATQQFGSW